MAFDISGWGGVISSATNLVGSGLQFGAAKKGAAAATQASQYNYLAILDANKVASQNDQLKYAAIQKIMIWFVIAMVAMVLLYTLLK